MSRAYKGLYERQIKRKALSEEEITLRIEHAHQRGLLTDSEYDYLVDLIAEYYSEES